MGSRNKVNFLPDEVKAWLDQNLVDSNFTGYEALAEELNKRGYDISKSSLGRYGKAFQDRIASIRQSTMMAKALHESVGDDQGLMGDAAIRMAQNILFRTLQKIDPDKLDDIELPKLMRAMADLNRASVAQKKWMVEVKEKAQAVAEEVETLATAEGLSKDSIEVWKRKILNIPQ